MIVTRLETLRLDEFPNLLWLRVHTDEGLVGLGETFFGAQAVEAYVHETIAPYLLGKNPLQIDLHARNLYGYLGYRSSGAETRGNSALDIALWDLFGKVTGQPIYGLLGGACRDRIRTYNTCAGYQYVRAKPQQLVANWGLDHGQELGPYEDLLASGITGMKIWPFDPYAEASNGTYISAADLDTALEPFRQIRQAVGLQMDIMVEFHSLWNLPAAKRIARALEEFEPAWFEDPLKADNLDALADFAASTHIPTTISETMSGRWAFREAFERGAAGVAMLDISWVGGISEAKKVATMAEAYQIPIAPHDCTGPVVWAASCHLSMNAPNALVQESVRAFYTGWYTELVTALPVVEAGMVAPPPGPGLGIELLPGLEDRPDAHRRVSALGQ